MSNAAALLAPHRVRSAQADSRSASIVASSARVLASDWLRHTRDELTRGYGRTAGVSSGMPRARHIR